MGAWSTLLCSVVLPLRSAQPAQTRDSIFGCRQALIRPSVARLSTFSELFLLVATRCHSTASHSSDATLECTESLITIYVFLSRYSFHYYSSTASSAPIILATGKGTAPRLSRTPLASDATSLYLLFVRNKCLQPPPSPYSVFSRPSHRCGVSIIITSLLPPLTCLRRLRDFESQLLE